MLLRAHDPHVAGSYGFCPFLLLTGQPCPGCGGLRSMNLLMHGDLAGAASSNLAAVVALAVGAVAWLVWTSRRARGVDASLFTWRAPAWTAVGVMLAVFWLLRVTPWGAWLAP